MGSKRSAGRRVVSVPVEARHRAQPHVQHPRDARIWMVIAVITRIIATRITSKRSARRRVVSVDEAHLMVTNPVPFLVACKEAGAKFIFVFHMSSNFEALERMS